MAKKDKPVDTRTCAMCKHSHSPHEMNSNHEPFLCKCPFHKWDRFLNKTMDVCSNFDARPEYVAELTKAGLINPFNRKR